MCFGPIKIEIDSDPSQHNPLIISNALDLIEISSKDASIAARNRFYFKFHVLHTFTNAKLHFILPFETDDKVNIHQDQTDWEEVSPLQLQYMKSAVDEVKLDKRKNEDADNQWVFGDLQKVIALLNGNGKKVEVQDLGSLKEAWRDLILKGATDYKPGCLSIEEHPIEHGHKHVVEELKGKFSEGDCFTLWFDCHNTKAIGFKNKQGGWAPLFYYNQSLFDEYTGDLDDVSLLDTVPLLFLQVILYIPNFLASIRPNYAKKRPINQSVRQMATIGGKEFADGRTFVVFKADDCETCNRFETTWEVEDKWRVFLNNKWTRIIIILAAILSIVGSLAAIAQLVMAFLR